MMIPDELRAAAEDMESAAAELVRDMPHPMLPPDAMRAFGTVQGLRIWTAWRAMTRFHDAWEAFVAADAATPTPASPPAGMTPAERYLLLSMAKPLRFTNPSGYATLETVGAAVQRVAEAQEAVEREAYAAAAAQKDGAK